MLIYKIFHVPEWQALRDEGKTEGAPVDLADGYIHFSDAATVRETASKHFASARDLVLVAVDADSLPDLRWEVSRGGALFPHLYAALSLSDVVWHMTLPLGADGVHVFPEDLT